MADGEPHPMQGCHAEYGGAVLCENAAPRIERVLFKNNRADVAGEFQP